MYRDVGLARISKDDLHTGHGTARQEQDVRRKSAETGGEMYEMFVENDQPASRFNKKERKKYEALLDLLRSGTRDRLIVYRLDRLTRIPRVLEDLIDLCEKTPFLVMNMHGTMDLNTAEGRKAARDRVNDAAFESDLISERTKRAFDQLAAAGVPHGDRAFGYACRNLRRCEGEDCCHGGKGCEHRPRHKRCCRIPGCPHDGLSVIDAEADEWRWGAYAALAGESLDAIARRWNNRGVRTPQKGSLWDGTTVKATLISARHAGLRVHRSEVIGKGIWEPLIDLETHERLKRKLCDPERKLKNPPRRQPFTGLFRTTEGHSLSRRTVRGRPTYAVTKRPGRGNLAVTIAAGPLEAYVLELLFQEIESGRLAAKVAERRAAEPTPAVEDPMVIQRQLVQLSEDHADPEIGLTRAEWLAQRAILLRRLEVAEVAWKAATASDALVDVDLDIRARWFKPEDDGGYSDERKRAILGSVFERVVIHPAIRKGGPGLDTRRVEPVWRE